MKFLSKSEESDLREEIYRSGADNSMLKLRLLNEQKNFCAYTEKFVVQGIDSVEVEHFNPSKKDNDDYLNYYATLRSANERKISKYQEYQESPFFQTLFFQKSEEFQGRIRYDDFVYEAIDDADIDAKNLIDYLGFNDDYLFGERIRHVERLQDTLRDLSEGQKLDYFRRYKRDLSFITAIEHAFQLDLSDILNEII